MIIKDSSANETQLSKRDLLRSIGMAGGSVAVFAAMQGWNLANATEPARLPPEVTSDGRGKKIIILGAGLAGMTIALELSKKGYECEIIEAQDKIGGRCRSARKGDVIHEINGEKQVCNYESGQYFNYGPWRIPAQHHPTLHYCRTLGVPLEPLINKSPMAYYLADRAEGPLKGKRLRQVDVDVDRLGYTEELLAKCADQGKLDDMVSAEDREMLLEFLKGQGLIDKRELNYKPNRIRGWKDYPGAGEDYGEYADIYKLTDLFKIKIATKIENEDHPIVMFQPVGGMDRIAFALYDNLPKGTVKLNKEVTNISQTDDGAQVSYFDTKTGEEVVTKGDYCISTIPFPVVTTIDNNFSPDLVNALKAPTSAPAFKQGLQFDRRFWEQDDMIYGGASMTDIPGHSVTAYPSSELHSNGPGVVLGSYIWGAQAAQISNLSIEDRVEFALSVGEKLHPGNFRHHYNGNAMTVAWHRMKYALGGWVFWTRRKRARNLPRIMQGENRILFSGNGLAAVQTGWMVGAFEGAWLTIKELDKRVSQS